MGPFPIRALRWGTGGPSRIGMCQVCNTGHSPCYHCGSQLTFPAFHTGRALHSAFLSLLAQLLSTSLSVRAPPVHANQLMCDGASSSHEGGFLLWPLKFVFIARYPRAELSFDFCFLSTWEFAAVTKKERGLSQVAFVPAQEWMCLQFQGEKVEGWSHTGSPRILAAMRSPWPLYSDYHLPKA